MQVLLINGSPHQNGCTYTALHECAQTLNALGIGTELVWIGAKPIAGCIACGQCRTTGACIFDDAVNRVAAQLDAFDGFLFGSPVYYGGPCGQIQAFMDRLFYSSGAKLAGKPAAAVVSCRRGGASAAFQRLNLYFQISNMPVVSSQYWNQVHGNTPQQVLQDEEGLQTMRTLARNMAWMLQSMDAARRAEVPAPHREPAIRTNFIR